MSRVHWHGKSTSTAGPGSRSTAPPESKVCSTIIIIHSLTESWNFPVLGHSGFGGPTSTTRVPGYRDRWSLAEAC
eukprot:1843010-Rhodomonas_salina.1